MTHVRHVSSRVARIGLIIALAVTLAPLTALAGQVFGHVAAEGRVLEPGTQFEVLRGDRVVTTVTVDENANYRVLLEPGSYRVRIKDETNWQATIQSLLDPVRQDIRFQKK